MKRSRLILIATITLAALAAPLRAEDGRGPKRADREQLRAKVQQVMAVRKCVRAFAEARSSGDQDAAMAAADEALAAWNALPDALRDRAEAKHPGTAKRILNLRNEYSAAPAHAAAAPAAAGGQPATAGPKTIKTHGTWTKDGNVVTHEATMDGPGDRSAATEGAFVKDGNVVEHDGTTTFNNGKVIEREGTFVKDGDTVTHEGTVTLPGGGVIEQESTRVKDGDTVTRDGTSTLPGGEVVTHHDTWEKDGHKVEHDGTSTGPKGTTTRESTLIKNKQNAVRHGTITRPDGTVIKRHDIYKKDGNTVTHDGTAHINPGHSNQGGQGNAQAANTVTAFTGRGNAKAANRKPTYRDELDIFGRGPKVNKEALENAKKKAAGAKAGKSKSVQYKKKKADGRKHDTPKLKGD